MYEITMIWGLDGPDARRVRRLLKQSMLQCFVGFHRDFEALKAMYKSLMETYNIKNILVEQAEDETAIVKYLKYDQRKDLIIGPCGPTTDHKCQESFTYVVGNDHESLVNFFKNSVIATMARVIIFNPLHINLPFMVVFLGCTCNSFDHKYVEEQWKECKKIYGEHFLDVFKAPLVGQASDGDSRRKKLMEMNGGKKDGERFRIDSDNFTVSGEIEKDDKNKIVSLNVPNQDYIHNGKKSTYPLDHATRKLTVGNHMTHLNHILLVREHS